MRYERWNSGVSLFVGSLTSDSSDDEKGDVMLERADYEAVERVEAELDQFINKRSREREEANQIEAAWAASERRVIAKRREANRQRWIDYFEHMHRLHLGIAAEHADRRLRLVAESGEEQGEGVRS